MIQGRVNQNCEATRFRKADAIAFGVSLPEARANVTLPPKGKDSPSTRNIGNAHANNKRMQTALAAD